MNLKIKLIIYLFIFSFGLCSAEFTYAANRVYYSVGQNTTSHETGAGTVTVSGNIATFSIPQTANNMGVGDVIDYDSDNKKCYILGKISTSQWTCTNAIGETPTAATNVIVNSISHAFNSLSSALPSGAGGAKTLLGNADLTVINVQLTIACYYDSGNDTTIVNIDGWTTDENRYIKVYVPYDTSNEINQNQRHTGRWSGEKYILQPSSDPSNATLTLNDNYIHIEGLQVAPYNAAFRDGIAINADYNYVSQSIIKGGGNDRQGINLLSGVNNRAYLWNNIIYGLGGRAIYEQANTTALVFLYNSIIHGCPTGIETSGSQLIARNIILQSASIDGYAGVFHSDSDYNISDLANDAPSPSYRTNLATDVIFVNEGGADFHLSESDAYAKDHGINLSSDANLAFASDIDNEGRPGTWDIGADEYTENGAFTVSGWVKMSGTSNVSKALVAKADELRLTTDDSGRPRCQVKSGGSWQAAAVASTALNLNEWAHVACAYDKSTLKVYINGAEKDSDSLSVGVDNTSNHLKFGVDDSADGTYGDFQGFMDEVRIYPYARSAVQMAFDYNAGMSGLSAKKGAGVTFGNESEKWMSDGLVGYWRMDESSWNGTASEVTDASGNNNHGTASGGATTDIGKFGKGGSFDGVDDGINLPYSNIGGELTYSVWFKKTAATTPANQVLLTFMRSLLLVRENNIRWMPDVDVNSTDVGWTQDTRWNHLVVSQSGTTCSIYLNGVAQLSGVACAAVDTANYGNEIGNSPIADWQFAGLIDEVRIYKRALSPDESIKLYQWGASPINHIKMDEKVSGDAKTLYDSSGRQNNAVTESGNNTSGMDCTLRGKYGSGCDLDGSDDFMQINDFDY